MQKFVRATNVCLSFVRKFGPLRIENAFQSMNGIGMTEKGDISSRACILREQAINRLNSDIAINPDVEVDREPKDQRSDFPEFEGTSFCIPMNNLSNEFRLFRIFFACVRFSILALIYLAFPVPVAISKMVIAVAVLLVVYEAYTWISRIEFTNFDFANGTITQYPWMNKWLRPRQYQFRDFGFVHESGGGLRPGWVSVMLSGGKGSLEIGRFDSDTIGRKFASIDAIGFRNILATRLKVRDLGHM